MTAPSPDPLAALVGKWRAEADWIVKAFPIFSAARVAETDVLRKCADELATALDASRVGVCPACAALDGLCGYHERNPVTQEAP